LIALFIFTVVLLSLYFLITQLASKFVARLEK